MTRTISREAKSMSLCVLCHRCEDKLMESYEDKLKRTIEKAVETRARLLKAKKRTQFIDIKNVKTK